MPAIFLGVRHHSPACARLVETVIASTRPAHVLIEGPADVNDRLDELLLGHELPIAVFSSYRDGQRSHASWAPLCDYSPEWVALTAGHRAGAAVRFIDLPGWHEALAGHDNRYSDAETRYGEVVNRLCARFAVDNVDTLWDHLFEIEPVDGLADRLATYFDLVRGEPSTPAAPPVTSDSGPPLAVLAVSPEDAAREEYMASWVRAAVAAAGERPVVVVTGGFHRPALVRLTAGATDGGGAAWPDVPRLPAGAVGGTYLVPYSFRRLDAFDGYQSGMPSPGYYQRLWDDGPAGAAAGLFAAVTARLRDRGQPVSTANLIAARTMADGLARLRGHPNPARVDVLDGLVATLVSEALDAAPPWSARGPLRPGTHPVLVEMVAALSGDRVGRLHPDTLLPPLVADVAAQLTGHGLDAPQPARPPAPEPARRPAGGRAGARARWPARLAGPLALDLTLAADLARSRVLHRLRVLGIPGFTRARGPGTGATLVVEEQWERVADRAAAESRLAALIEAGSYGPTLLDAAAARVTEAVEAAGDHIGLLADALFDAALCGTGALSERVLAAIGRTVGSTCEFGALGRVLGVVLGLWRHGRLLGIAGDATLAAVAAATAERVLWLAEGIRGGPAPVDLARVGALAAARDACRYAGPTSAAPSGAGAAQLIPRLDRGDAVATMGRIAVRDDVPPDLRGAAFGFGWSLGAAADPERAVRGAARPDTLGDWLAGLFALAREEVLAAEPNLGPAPAEATGLLAVLDDLLGGLTDDDFLVALPALRQAFVFFPPRERDRIARLLLARHGWHDPVRALLRLPAPPAVLLRARALERQVDTALTAVGLLPTPVPEETPR